MARRNAYRTPTHVSWENMLQRCRDPKHKSYDAYGGRGIKVCDRWHGFENFLADMGERPEGMTLDRFPNKEGNYEPGNCRWATATEQARNRSTNRHLTLDGVTLTIKEWATKVGGSHQAIAYRLRAGWSLREALTRAFDHGNGWTRGVR